MASLDTESNATSISVNILIKKEDGLFIAHCLELDIIAVCDTLDNARKEVISLVCAQIDYAFSNDNLENLYHPAPQEVWVEFFKCKEKIERKYKLESGFKKEKNRSFLPPLLTTNTCQPKALCHV